jgi:methylphosphotriester-DNA--protein-cysteine methyltransferase
MPVRRRRPRVRRLRRPACPARRASGRLTRIRRDLLDPALATRTAAAIAARWGMDPGHLSRALRKEFGLIAAEIRRMAVPEENARSAEVAVARTHPARRVNRD